MPLSIHFLNVGHGDCTLIEHPSGRITMIDINNSKSLPESDVDALADFRGLSREAFASRASAPAGFESWEQYYRSLLVDPYDYFRSTFGASASVFRYIQTHPDMDHMSGLHRFFWQEQVSLQNFWDTDHGKSFVEADFENSGYSHLDWLVYQCMKAGVLRDGAQHQVLNLAQGAAAQYYLDDGIAVLSPTQNLVKDANDKANWNNLSYVLRVEHAGRSVVLPGDAEKAAWDEMLATLDHDDLSCDILKASHHGRESGYSKDAMEVMNPAFVVCSVGKKPSTDASDEYKSHGATVLSTRYHGTITIRIGDDGAIAVRNHDNSTISSLGATRPWLTA